MAVTLDSLVKISTLSQNTNTQNANTQATDVFKRAEERVAQQLNTTDVQLSAFGKIKAGFAEVQAAGKDLADPKKTGTADNARKAVQSFADAFNNATKAVNTAIKGDGKVGGALNNDNRARLAANDLKQIVTGGNNEADLNKVGINVNKDGTLSVDAKVLQSAIKANPNAARDTFARIGRQAEQVSKKELANTGNIGSSVNTLNTRSRDLEARKTEQQNIASSSQANVQRQVASIGNGAAGGIAAYAQILSL